MAPLAVIEASVGTCPVSPSVLEEIAREEPGQQILLDRTMDLMLITALRAWFTRPGAEIPTWHRAHSDPVVAPALRLLHADPAHPWTLPALGAKAGASRAHLARRFNALVGQPPMTYLRTTPPGTRRRPSARDRFDARRGGRPRRFRQRLRPEQRVLRPDGQLACPGRLSGHGGSARR
ncbi:cupin domain-containing protein [Streptomyces massasporeus]|uniref:cupin domain-containing protein n=1 Tax=Streptomyces massasporeus TaxID=67324 RepID=UPI0036E5E777